jgi:hypothetical protein
MHQPSSTIPDAPKKVNFWEILFTPIGCLVQFPPVIMFGLLLIAFLAGSYLYNYVNIDLFGIGAPPYDKLLITNNYKNIELPAQYTWKIEYEKIPESKFIGKVRHASPIRIDRFLVLTHDILVTTGDFADPQKVTTSVSNHKFTWMTRLGTPEGKINLLHTVPASEEIYKQLLTVQNDMQVDIRGREIYRLYAYGENGKVLGWWEDSGCNTLLVTSVKILSNDTIK